METGHSEGSSLPPRAEQIDQLIRRAEVPVDTHPTILLVDDEPENLEVLSAILDIDYQVVLAENANSALKHLEENPDIALVITDQRMPGMSGVELLGVIAEDYPMTIRMVLTGYSDLEPILNAINRGSAYRFLFKPWDHNELRATVRDAVSLWQTRVALPILREKMLERRDSLRDTVTKLQRTQEQLVASERLGTLGRLTSGITHDIRNNLTVMTHIVDALQAEATDQTVVSSADQALDSLEAVLALVNDINAFARRGERSMVARELSVLGFLTNTVQFYGMESEGVDIGIRCDDAIETWSFDEQRVRQAMLALLRNAERACPKGPIEVRGQLVDDALLLSVHDNGVGMDAETLRQAPEPFFSAFEPKGLGLGLEIASLVAQDHGGVMGLESQAGQGTTAALTLKRKSDD